MSNGMLDACTAGGGFMLFTGLLVLAVLGLGIAALVKYLTGPQTGSNSRTKYVAPRATDAPGDITWPA